MNPSIASSSSRLWDRLSSRDDRTALNFVAATTPGRRCNRFAWYVTDVGKECVYVYDDYIMFMTVYIYIYIYIYVCMYDYVYIYILYVYVYTYMCVCTVYIYTVYTHHMRHRFQDVRRGLRCMLAEEKAVEHGQMVDCWLL